MAQPPTVVVLGGINMDLVSAVPRLPRPGETVVGTRFFTTPGGKGANQAVACARLGARTRMVGRVGGDAFAAQLLEALQAAGVDAAAVARDPEAHSGIAVISVDATGQNAIVQVWGANARVGAPEVARARHALADADALLLQHEVPVDASLQAAREARALGRLVVLDPAPALQHPSEELLRLADYLTPNETEAEALVGFAVPDVAAARTAARRLRERGVRCPVVKLGERGACYATAEGEGHVPPFQVEVVDTVAAGDAFNAALAVALAEGRPLPEALRWACAAGALAVTKPGAQDAMPHRAEVEALLRRQPPRDA